MPKNLFEKSFVNFFSGNCIFPGADPSSAAGGTLRLHHEEQEELSVAQLDRVRKKFFIFYFFENETGKKTKELFKENYNCHLRSINQSLGLLTSLFLNYPRFLITTRTIKIAVQSACTERQEKITQKIIDSSLCVK